MADGAPRVAPPRGSLSPQATSVAATPVPLQDEEWDLSGSPARCGSPCSWGRHTGYHPRPCQLQGLPNPKAASGCGKRAWPHHQRPRRQHARKSRSLTDPFGKHMCYLWGTVSLNFLECLCNCQSIKKGNSSRTTKCVCIETYKETYNQTRRKCAFYPAETATGGHLTLALLVQNDVGSP